ncbi:MAG: hypothetical protein IPM98_13905 [Lewinellaceae bacterium]|nr:hypothetical protein [Lewinellaceae bacterium]
MIWQNILRSVLVGTDRYPVPDAVLAALGQEAADDAARTALYALPAAFVLRRAAAPIEDTPATAQPPCPESDRPLCPAAAVQPLVAMLRYDACPKVLPEYFELLQKRGWRLPPEIIPEALDFLARKNLFSPAVRAALEPEGVWLAAQNPAWADLANTGLSNFENAAENPDWPASVPDWAQDDTLLETPDSELVRLLLKSEQMWPKALLHLVLEYPLRNAHPRHWSPPKHLRQLLQRAALRCRPADVLDMAPPDREWPYAWHSELVQFRGVVQFRQKIWTTFGA